MTKQPELLAPVGKIDSFYAAVESGANAVYVGGKQFSARQHADNLDLEELKQIIDYAHLRNIKVYITLNTLIKNNELKDLVKYIHELALINIDGLIIQDFGVSRILKLYFPNLSIHGSTQLSAHSTNDVMFLQEDNYKRVILARELSLDEIRNIKNKTSVELESFVHGALCVSYSGQCLMSGIIGGRSGNRGRCAQPCRLPYTFLEDGLEITDSVSPYLLSPKDIETLDLIPDLIDIGINSFKIEGRMKSPEYVSSTVRNYRKYIDKALAKNSYKVDQEDKNELMSVFNRGGFTKGYLTEEAGENMMATSSPKNIGLQIGKVVSYDRNIELASIETNKELFPGDGIAILMANNEDTGTGISRKTPAGKFSIKVEGNISEGDKVYLSKNHNLNKNLESSRKTKDRKSPISVRVNAKIGKPLEIELIHSTGIKAQASGTLVSEARNAPLSKKDLESQISRFGSTPFNVGEITTTMDSNIYIRIKEINKLRRTVSEKLENNILKQNLYDGQAYDKFMEDQRDTLFKEDSSENKNKDITALVANKDQLQVCAGKVDTIYWELNTQSLKDIKESINLCHEQESKLYIALPHIQRNSDYEIYKDLMEKIEKTNIDGYLIRTIGQFKALEASTKNIVLDHTFNIMNNQSASYWEEKDVEKITLSVEMSLDEISTMNSYSSELIVYGHLPIMTSEQCLIDRYGLCQSNYDYTLLDRKDKEYPIKTNCKLCRMQILSEKPIIMLDSSKEVENLPLDSIRLNFTLENPIEVDEIISFYKDGTMTHNINGTNVYFKNGVK